MNMKQLTYKQKLLILTCIAITVFAMPQILRTTLHHDSMLGSTTYYHRRVAHLVVSGQQIDPLSFGGRPITYPPGFSWMIVLTPLPEFLLAPLIGGLGIIVGYYFVKELGLTDKQALYSSMFLFFNPAYAYFAVHLNPRLPAIIMMVIAYIMINKDNKKINYLSAIPVAASLITSPMIGATLIVVGLIAFRKKIKKMVAPFSAATLAFMIHFVPIIAENGLFQSHEAYEIFTELNRGIQYFILESGLTAISFTVVMVILAAYGFFKLNDPQSKPVREWLLIGTIASLAIFNRMNDVLIYPVSILAGVILATHVDGLRETLKLEWIPRKWLKRILWAYLIILVVVPGIGMITIDPSPEQHEAMMWIKQNTPENATIMAYWWEGHYITGIADRRNVMDAYLEFAPEVDERYEDVRMVMFGSRAEKTIEIMQKYNAEYILYRIDTGRNHCSGFPYVSKHGKFEEVFSNEEYRIYKLREEPISPGSDLCEAIDEKRREK